MRDYKFRGKRVDNGEWVYGKFLKLVMPDEYFILPIGSDVFPELFSDNDEKTGRYLVEAVKVIPETVGQFTNLHDKNGVEIYEGDWIQLTILDEDSCCGRTYTKTYKIIWSNRKKVFELHDGKDYVLGDYKGFHRPDITYITDSAISILIEELEIVGNIHDQEAV